MKVSLHRNTLCIAAVIVFLYASHVHSVALNNEGVEIAYPSQDLSREDPAEYCVRVTFSCSIFSAFRVVDVFLNDSKIFTSIRAIYTTARVSVASGAYRLSVRDTTTQELLFASAKLIEFEDLNEFVSIDIGDLYGVEERCHTFISSHDYDVYEQSFLYVNSARIRFFFDRSAAFDITEREYLTRSAVVVVSNVSGDCYECKRFPLTTVEVPPSGEAGNYTKYILFDVKWGLTLQFDLYLNNASFENGAAPADTFVLKEYQFGGHGFYTVSVYEHGEPDGTIAVAVSVDDPPQDALLPILIALAVFIVARGLWVLVVALYKNWKSKREATQRLERKESSGKLPMKSPRSHDNAGPSPEAVSLLSAGASVSYDSNRDVENVNSWKTGDRERDKPDPQLRQRNTSSSPAAKAVAPVEANAALHSVAIKERLQSLDTFRGLALTIMIFVNYGGGAYWFLDHSRWNGLTIADLVFPWFIWIMGTTCEISMASLRRKKVPKRFIVRKIVRRGLILFGLGLFFNNGYNPAVWRIPGVLQRFGLSYLIVALLNLFIPPVASMEASAIAERNTEAVGGKRRAAALKYHLRDLLPYVFQWLVALVFPAIWLGVTFGLDVPGCGRGYLGAGGRYTGDGKQFVNCTGGAAGYIDREILGVSHLYDDPTCKDVYGTGPYDPEGILGYTTSVFLTFLGLQSGRILVIYKGHKERLVRWTIWGLAWSLLGAVLCGFSKNEGVIPLNKNLWSFSFVCVMGGTGFLSLAVMYAIIDVLKWWKSGAPFRYVGMNSIVIYCGHGLLQGYFPFSYATSIPFTFANQLTMNLIGVSCWVLIAYYMYLQDFFIKI